MKTKEIDNWLILVNKNTTSLSTAVTKLLTKLVALTSSINTYVKTTLSL